MKRFLILAASAALVLSCAPAAKQSAPVLKWEKHVMDGHMTGVSAVIGEDYTSALGSVENGVYTAPNGKKFSKGATPAVAADMLAVQPQMARLKEVLGHSPRPMEEHGKNGGLGEWSADAVMKGVESVTGRKVDFAIINHGGIRTSMPAGDILLDDIVSMFPFKNYLCYVALKGSDVRAIFEDMAKHHIQAVAGVDVVVNEGKLESLLIGGNPVDDNATYGLGTIDFLLDGGDGLFLAKNAQELVVTKTTVNQWMVPYIKSLTAAGKEIEYTDPVKHVVYKGERRRPMK